MAVATPERECAEHGRLPADAAPTLEAVVVRAWEGLRWDGRCACPVCAGDMSMVAGPAGTCGSCGSELS